MCSFSCCFLKESVIFNGFLRFLSCFFTKKVAGKNTLKVSLPAIFL